jgi:hypothetical protein
LPGETDEKEDGRRSRVRLYCIPIGEKYVILGNGGVKPIEKRSLAENPTLHTHVKILRQLNIKLQESLRLRKTSIKHGDIIGISEFEIEIV